MPKVSVVIPCFNHGQYLNETVDSVLAQTFSDFEIIVVNDGSTDDLTNQLLSEYKKAKTQVIAQDNHGLPHARNSGIRASSGKYIVCLDSDDKLHPKYMATLVPILDDDHKNEFGFVMPWAQLFGDYDFVWETAAFNPYLLGMRHGMHVTAPFRRECWVKVGGFKEEMTSGYEDWDFWLSVVAAGYKWVTVEEPLFLYRKRPDSMVTRTSQIKYDLIRKIIRNNRDYYNANLEDIIINGIKHFEEAVKHHHTSRMDSDNTTEHVKVCTNVEYKKMERMLHDLTTELETMKSSCCWRLTAPLRFVTRFIRRRFGAWGF